MRIRNRLAAWLGHPINLALGIIMLGVDIATVVRWAQDDDSLTMNIRLGPPEYAFILFVCTTFGGICLWGWYATFPHRPSLKFKALYGEIAAARAAFEAYMLSRFDQHRTMLEADSRYVELAAKLLQFGIELPGHDISDINERADRWNLLTELAAHAATGNVKAARAHCEQLAR